MNSLPLAPRSTRDPHGVCKTAYFASSMCALLIASHNTAHALPILTSGSVQSTVTLVTPANTFSLTTTATSPIGIFNQAVQRSRSMDPSGAGDGTYSTNTQDSLNQWWVSSVAEIQLYGRHVSPLDGSGSGRAYAYLTRSASAFPGGPYANGTEQYYTLGDVGNSLQLATFGTLSGSTSQTVAFEITTDTPMGRVWLNNSGTEVTLANSLDVGSTWFLFQYDNSSELVSSGSEATTFNSAPSAWHVNVSTVPEPSTYAVALGGLACGGFSVWRRRKRRLTSGGRPPSTSRA